MIIMLSHKSQFKLHLKSAKRESVKRENLLSETVWKTLVGLYVIVMRDTSFKRENWLRESKFWQISVFCVRLRENFFKLQRVGAGGTQLKNIDKKIVKDNRISLSFSFNILYFKILKAARWVLKNEK